MRPVPFAVGWVFLMLAVILAAASISHHVYLREEEDDPREGAANRLPVASGRHVPHSIVLKLMEVPDGKVG